MSDQLVDLTNLNGIARAEKANPVDDSLSDQISLVALKFDSENIEISKKLTTEGMSLSQRIEYIGKLKNQCGKQIFEFSTCNRILYVGFDISCADLTTEISKLNSLEEIPFSHFDGMEAWRHLVKICSGLDSFILGELQVMSQFRKSVNMHRDNQFISTANSSFFEHVIAANRTVRKQFGFTQTTESMLSLATSKLKEILDNRGDCKTVVLGFGDMGIKAVEALIEFGQTEITVVSREPAVSRKRHEELASFCTMISYEDWHLDPDPADIVISTIRNISSTYNESNPIPVDSELVVLDFAWPPSVDMAGVNSMQTLLGMEYWITASRNLGEEWNYESTISKSESMISEIESRYVQNKSLRNQAAYRSLIYSALDQLSQQWEALPTVSENEIKQMGAFAREIATWVCHKERKFLLSELDSFILENPREVSLALKEQITLDVRLQILSLSKNEQLSGGI